MNSSCQHLTLYCYRGNKEDIYVSTEEHASASPPGHQLNNNTRKTKHHEFHDPAECYI